MHPTNLEAGCILGYGTEIEEEVENASGHEVAPESIPGVGRMTDLEKKRFITVSVTSSSRAAAEAGSTERIDSDR